MAEQKPPQNEENIQLTLPDEWMRRERRSSGTHVILAKEAQQHSDGKDKKIKTDKGNLHSNLLFPDQSSRRASSVSPSIVSISALKEHDKFQGGGGREDAQINRIASWISSVSLTKGQLPEDTPSVEDSPKSPKMNRHVTIQAPPDGGDEEEVEEGRMPPLIMEIKASDQAMANAQNAKLERVKSLLRADSEGNLVDPVEITVKGRYKAHAKDDKAFEKIGLDDMQIILDPDTPANNSQTSISSRRLRAKAHEIRKASIMSRASTNTYSIFARPTIDMEGSEFGETETEVDFPTGDVRPASRGQGRRLSILAGYERRSSLAPSTSTSVAETTPSFGTVCTDKSQLTSGSLPPGQRKKDSTAMGMIGTMMKAKTWIKKTKTKTKKSFAKDDAHYQLLNGTAQKIAVDMPIPLRITLHEELFPVIQSTVKSYEKGLGKMHPMTKQAKDKMNELKTWGDVLTSL